MFSKEFTRSFLELLQTYDRRNLEKYQKKNDYKEWLWGMVNRHQCDNNKKNKTILAATAANIIYHPCNTYQ